LESTSTGLPAGAGEEGFREVNAGDLKLRKAGGEAAGVKAGAAADFEEMMVSGSVEDWGEGVRDFPGVIGEEMFATHGVEPPTSFEEGFFLNGRNVHDNWLHEGLVMTIGIRSG
jgi:hypothetical protein